MGYRSFSLRNSNSYTIDFGADHTDEITSVASTRTKLLQWITLTKWLRWRLQWRNDFSGDHTGEMASVATTLTKSLQWRPHCQNDFSGDHTGEITSVATTLAKWLHWWQQWRHLPLPNINWLASGTPGYYLVDFLRTFHIKIQHLGTWLLKPEGPFQRHAEEQ